MKINSTLVGIVVVSLLIGFIPTTQATTEGVNYSIDRSSDTILPGDYSEYTLTLENQDNYAVTLDLEYEIIGGVIGVSVVFLPSSSVVIGGYGTEDVTVRVSTSSNSAPGTFDIDISYVTSQAFRADLGLYIEIPEIESYTVEVLPNEDLGIEQGAVGYFKVLIENTGNVPLTVEAALANVTYGWDAGIGIGFLPINSVTKVVIEPVRDDVGIYVGAGRTSMAYITLSNQIVSVTTGSLDLTTSIAGKIEVESQRESGVLLFHTEEIIPVLQVVLIGEDTLIAGPGDVATFKFNITNLGDGTYVSIQLLTDEVFEGWLFEIIHEKAVVNTPEYLYFLNTNESKIFVAQVTAPDDSTMAPGGEGFGFGISVIPASGMERSVDKGFITETSSGFTGEPVLPFLDAVQLLLITLVIVFLVVIGFATYSLRKRKAAACPKGFELVGEECLPKGGS